jgi:acyl-coenzyme A thioesterase 13
MDVGAMLNGGFDRSLTGLEVFEIGTGRIQARLVVGESVQNFFGKLHGGAIATLVDDIGTFAVMTADHYHRAGVTTDLHVSYLAPAETGASVLIEAEVLSCGLTLAFVEVTLRRESRGDMIARGRMTKLLGNVPAPRPAPAARAKP